MADVAKCQQCVALNMHSPAISQAIQLQALCPGETSWGVGSDVLGSWQAQQHVHNPRPDLLFWKVSCTIR
jgi:hypothetical protein